MAESLWRRVLFPSHRTHGPAGLPKTHDVPQVLVITASASDQTFYKSVRARGEWDMVLARSASEALRLLATQAFPIVLYDRDLPGWDWREVLVRMLETSPRICFLLTSRVSDAYLWREVVKHGGYDVVARPLEEGVVVQTLRRAWYYWKAGPPPAKPAV
jgi:DNA-binding NtrC family response regulator